MKPSDPREFHALSFALREVSMAGRAERSSTARKFSYGLPLFHRGWFLGK